MDRVYLNNAATSFPKPRSVIDATSQSLSDFPCEPGRQSNGVDPLIDCRRELAGLLGVGDEAQVILLGSATIGLNLVINGLLRDGGRAVCSTLAHNSVLRPLAHAKRDFGVTTTLIEADREGRVSGEQFDAHLDGSTRLAVITHISNITGSIQPIDDIAAAAAAKGVPLLIDAAQSAGVVPVSWHQLPGRVFLAFAGHKGLMGPSGTGGLVVPDNRLAQTVVGGTGVHSESVLHPEFLPLRHEAGTPNLPGIAGLTAGVRFVARKGVVELGRSRHTLVSRIRRQLEPLVKLRLSPLPEEDGRTGIVSMTVDHQPPRELAYLLEQSFGIVTRAGLHCAPLAHRSLGTAPAGTVRVSVGPFTTEADVDRLCNALHRIVGR